MKTTTEETKKGRPPTPLHLMEAAFNRVQKGVTVKEAARLAGMKIVTVRNKLVLRPAVSLRVLHRFLKAKRDA